MSYGFSAKTTLNSYKLTYLNNTEIIRTSRKFSFGKMTYTIYTDNNLPLQIKFTCNDLTDDESKKQRAFRIATNISNLALLAVCITAMQLLAAVFGSRSAYIWNTCWCVGWALATAAINISMLVSASKTGYELRIYSSDNNDATAVSKFSKALEITFVCLEIITCVIATLISIFVL